MNYDTIKILNLESINVDLNKSFIIKNNDKLFYLFNLSNTFVSASKMLSFPYSYVKLPCI